MQCQGFLRYQQYCCCAECCCSLSPFPRVDFESKSSSQTPAHHSDKLTSSVIPPVVRNKGHLNTKLHSLCVSRNDALDLRGGVCNAALISVSLRVIQPEFRSQVPPTNRTMNDHLLTELSGRLA